MMTAAPTWVVHPGELVQEALAERGVSQGWLAREAGFTRTHVNQVLAGRHAMGARFCVEVGRVLNLSPYVLARMQADHTIATALGHVSA